MPSPKPVRRPPRPVSPAKADADPRRRLLEAAGQVFAEKGFDRATGKEICERAGTNAAAVNYYFGGIEPLYVAVVNEAFDRLPTVDALAAAVADRPTPEDQFHALLDLIVRRMTGPLAASWAMRIISREFLNRSPLLESRREREAVPKMRLVRDVVGQVMRLPHDHPAVARGCFQTLAPLIMLIIGDRRTLKRALPSLAVAAADADMVVREMACYGLAGLAAVAADAKRRTAGAAHSKANDGR